MKTNLWALRLRYAAFALCLYAYWLITGDSNVSLLTFTLATTAMCTSFKNEATFQAGHCFNATLSGLAGAGANGAFTVTGLASTAGIAVGMAFTATNAAAGAVVASVDSASQVTVSKAHTGIITSGTIAFTADVFKMLLIKVTPVRTFDGTQTNVGTPGTSASSATNVGTDEVTAGGGYTSGGTALTNVSGITSGTTAFNDFNPDPSWSSATFSCTAGIIYNTSTRLGAAAAPLNGRTCSVHDFGGTQTVSAGTLTVVLPAAAAGTAIMNIA